jgi:hypothetical protein
MDLRRRPMSPKKRRAMLVAVAVLVVLLLAAFGEWGGFFAARAQTDLAERRATSYFLGDMLTVTRTNETIITVISETVTSVTVDT